MKVTLIQSYLAPFSQFIRSRHSEFFFKWQCQDNFTKKWSFQSVDFGAMYDQALQSKISASLWEGSKYSAKSAMLTMAAYDTSFCQSMFRDLFEETKDMNQRISRFLFHSSELLQQMRRKGSSLIDHHHNERLVSLYLCFRYPEHHCLFEPDRFSVAGAKIGLKDAPAPFEYDRFQRLAKTLGILIRKESEVINSYPFPIGANQLLVHDFYEWLATS